MKRIAVIVLTLCVGLGTSACGGTLKISQNYSHGDGGIDRK